MRAHLPDRPARGFTLMELAVSLVVTAILTAAAVTLLTQQQRSLRTTTDDRAIQETARTALGELGTSLRRAGFAVEPSRAFDFDSYACAAPVQCRDSVAGPDEIVFHARDPGFKASLAAAPSEAQLVITGGLQSPLYAGQILQVMCPSASEWAYVTVGQTVAPNWTPPAAQPATTTIPLAAAAGGPTFPRENADLVAPGSCFQVAAVTSSLRVYRIDRFRYYVASFVDPDTGLPRPYLMLDRGLSDAEGARLEPIAPDVEDVQFEYVFVNPVTNAVSTVGNVSGTRLAADPASIDLAVAPPAYDAPARDPSRVTNHPANVRAVRVHVVVRTAATDLAKERDVEQPTYSEGTRLIAAANRPTVPAANGHVRIRVETTEATRNLEARSPYYDP